MPFAYRRTQMQWTFDPAVHCDDCGALTTGGPNAMLASSG